MFSNVYLSVADIANPDFFACGCRNWICLDIDRHPACPHARLAQTNGRSRWEVSIQFAQQSAKTVVTAPALVVWSLSLHDIISLVPPYLLLSFLVSQQIFYLLSSFLNKDIIYIIGLVRFLIGLDFILTFLKKEC